MSSWQVFVRRPIAGLTEVVDCDGGRCIAFLFTNDNADFKREGLLRQDENGDVTAGSLLVDHALYFGFDGFMFDMEGGRIAAEDKHLVLDLFRAMHDRSSKGGLAQPRHGAHGGIRHPRNRRRPAAITPGATVHPRVAHAVADLWAR